MADYDVFLKSSLKLDIKEGEEKLLKLKQLANELTKIKLDPTTTAKDLQTAEARLEAVNKKMRDLRKEIKSNNAAFKQLGEEGGGALSELANSSGGIAGNIMQIGAAFASVSTIKGFIQQVFQLRSEFQDAESTMITFLGSVEKGTKYFNELKDYAWYNMFEFKDLQEASTQLIAYGNAQKDLIPIIDKLSNVASATNKPLMQYIEMWNRAKSVGYVDSRSMQTWGASGVELKKILEGIGEKVNGNKVSFDQLKMAIDSVTSSGGQFYGTMDAKMSNLSSSLGQLQDTWNNMLNEVGVRWQDKMKGTLELASTLVENYEKVGKVLTGLIVTYGAYRTMLMAVRAIETEGTILHAISAYVKLQRTLTSATAAQAAFNTVSKANVYVALASAVMGLVAALAVFSKKKKEVVEDTQALNEAQMTSVDTSTQEMTAMHGLFEVAKDLKKSTEERRRAINTLNKDYGSYIGNLITETTSVNSLADAYARASKAMMEKHLTEKKTEMIGDKADIVANYMNSVLGSSEGDAKARVGMERAVRAYVTSEQSADEDLRTGLENAVDNLNATTYAKKEMVDKMEEYVKEYKTAYQGYSKYESYYKDAVSAFLAPGDAYTTSVPDVIKDIKDAEKEIRRLEAQARTGLTQAEKESLTLYRTKLQSAKSEYQNLTGKAYDSGAKMQETLYKLNQQQLQRTLKLDREYQNAENTLAQHRIDAMAEGNAKVLAQNEHNYQLELQQIQRQREDKLKQLQDEAKAEWMARNPNAKESQYKQEITALPKEWVDMYAQMEKDAEEKKNRAVLDARAKFIDQYGTFEQKRAQLAKKWNDTIAAEDDEAIKHRYEKVKELELATMEYDHAQEYGTFDQKMQALKKKWEAEIASLASAGEKAAATEKMNAEMYDLKRQYDGVYMQIFSDIDNMSRGMLESTIDLAEQELQNLASTGNATVEQLAEMRDRITQLKSASKELMFGGWGGSMEGIASALYDRTMVRKNKSALEEEKKKLQERMNAGAQSGDVAYNSTGGGYFRDKEKLEDLQRQIDRTDDSEKKLTADMKKMAATVAASGAAKLFGEIADNLKALADISGNDTFGRVAEGFSAIGSAVGNIASGFASGGIVGGIAAAIGTVGSAVVDAVSSVAIANAQWNKFIDDFKNNLDKLSLIVDSDDYKNIFGTDDAQMTVDAYSKAQKAIASFTKASSNLRSMNVKTKDYSTWANMFGKKDEQRSLASFDIWGNDGLLDVDKAQAFLNASTQITDSQRQQIQNAIELKQAYEDAMNVVKDYASNMLGNFADDIGNIVVDSILSGKDAFDDLESVGLSVIDNLARSMASSWVLENYLGSFNDDLVAAFGTGNTSGITDIVSRIMEGLPAAVDTVTGMVEGIYNYAERTGMDIDQLRDSTREAASRGVATASQDSIDEQNGRLTAIQGQTYEINESVSVIKNQNAELAALSGEILRVVMGIHDDTSSMNEKMDELKEMSASTNSYLGRIVDRGVKAL